MTRIRPAALLLAAGLIALIGVPSLWTLTNAESVPSGAPHSPTSLGPAPTVWPTPTPPIPPASDQAGQSGSTSTVRGSLAAIPPLSAVPISEPVRLTIPRVGISTPIDPTGVAPDGQAEIPADARRVGWYRFGAAPGSEAGNAVIVGHRDSRAIGAGALFDVADVRPGDLVTVDRADGSQLRYQVLGLRSFAKSSAPWAQIFARSGPAALVVVTCGGRYLPEAGGYQDNLVMTARLVPTSAAVGP